MHKIEELLAELGLDTKEIKVLVTLIKLGHSAVGKIALASGITRTHIYDIADALKKRGLVTETAERGVRRFEAIDHAGLMALLSQKHKDLEVLQKKFAEAVSDFEALHMGAKQRTTVRFFEGPEGVRSIYAEIRGDLKKQTSPFELLTVFSPDAVERMLPGWFEQEEYIDVPPFMKKRGILFESAVMQAYLEKMKISKSEHAYKIWPKERGEFPVDTLCWLNKITYIDLIGFPSGIIIENEAIVKVFKMWFEKMWESL